METLIMFERIHAISLNLNELLINEYILFHTVAK